MAPAVKDIVASLDSLSSETFDDNERWKITESLRKALDRVQSPFERAWELTIAQPYLFAACQILIDLGVWQEWRAADGGEKTLDELLEMCKQKCEPNLLRRIMRMLIARNVVEETGVDRYKATAFSVSLGDDELAERSIEITLCCGTHHSLPVALQMPQTLAAGSYEEPTDAKKAAYIEMPENKEGLSFFTRCRWKPEYQESFVALMSNITAWKQNWTDYFDTDTLFDKAVQDNQESPLLVNVGGNAGVDIMRFLEKHPDIADGSLVLQDVGDVIAMAKVDTKKVTAMTYDFFTRQPVFNSRVYFFHSILHDWPDDLALKILANVKPAFKPGYSKLLIADVVIPAEGTSVMQAAHDLCLMSLLSAVERTEAAWGDLLDKAGFKVNKVWKDSRGIESVIEAELKDIDGSEEVESNLSDE